MATPSQYRKKVKDREYLGYNETNNPQTKGLSKVASRG